MNKLYLILKKNLSKKKFKILTKKYKKKLVVFNKNETHQVVVIEKCNLKREPLILDFCAEKRVKNHYYKIADETSYSKVSQVFRNKIILKRYKDKFSFQFPKSLTST